MSNHHRTQGVLDGTAYTMVRPPHPAPVVVLIHGLGLCQQIWAATMPALSDQYCVISYDLYGHGKSAPYHGVTSLSVYAEQIAKLLTALELNKAALVGFSIGGMINRRFGMDYPERLSAAVILNSPHTRAPQAQLDYEQRASQVRELGSTGTLQASLKRWFTPPFRAAHPEVLASVTQWLTTVDQESYAQTLWVLVTGVKELTRARLPIKVPCLVVTGEHDTGSTPAMSYAIAEQLDNAEVVIFDTLQHLGLLERPDLYNVVVGDFLTKAIQTVK